VRDIDRLIEERLNGDHRAPAAKTPTKPHWLAVAKLGASFVTMICLIAALTFQTLALRKSQETLRLSQENLRLLTEGQPRDTRPAPEKPQFMMWDGRLSPALGEPPRREAPAPTVATYKVIAFCRTCKHHQIFSVPKGASVEDRTEKCDVCGASRWLHLRNVGD
jgi:hypothetical protein